VIALLFAMTVETVLKGSKSMSRRKRRNHAPAFKAQVALAAMKGDRTLAELAQQYDLHPNQITDWKTQLLERASQVFDGPAPEPGPDLKVLHAKIGQLALENDFLESALIKAGKLSARR
jgi:transposase